MGRLDTLRPFLFDHHFIQPMHTVGDPFLFLPVVFLSRQFTYGIFLKPIMLDLKLS